MADIITKNLGTTAKGSPLTPDEMDQNLINLNTYKLEVDDNGNLVLDATGAISLPTGTALERPSSPYAGMMRFNSDTGSFEGYDGTEWGDIGVSSPGIADSAVAPTLYIDDAGNIGIGASIPADYLLAYKGIAVNGGNNTALSLTAVNYASLMFGTDADPDLSNITYDFINTAMRFFVEAGERMRLTPIGLGIGVTLPEEKLHVAGKSKADSFITGDFEIVHNINTGSLDFNYVG